MIAMRPSSRRGTTNRNVRGNAKDRLARRRWLVETFRSDVVDASEQVLVGATCRCYRCGTLLTVDTVTVDRVIPGCRGGTYRRNNIRPCCGPCNTLTGASTRSAK